MESLNFTCMVIVTITAEYFGGEVSNDPAALETQPSLWSRNHSLVLKLYASVDFFY